MEHTPRNLAALVSPGMAGADDGRGKACERLDCLMGYSLPTIITEAPPVTR